MTTDFNPSLRIEVARRYFGDEPRRRPERTTLVDDQTAAFYLGEFRQLLG